MKNAINLIVLLVLLSVAHLAPGNAPASQPQKKDKQAKSTQPKPSADVPTLFEIIPLTAELTGHLENLKNELNQLAEQSSIEKEYAATGAELEEATLKYKQIKDVSVANIAKIYSVRREVANRKSLLETVSEPLKEEISRVDSWKTQWLEEKTSWGAWQSSLLKDHPPEQLKLAFKKAHNTIDTGLDLVLQRLDNLLALQAKGGDIAGRLDAFDADLYSVILAAREEYLFSKAPALLSIGYLAQFRSELWSVALEDLRLLSWPGFNFYSKHGWAFLLQICLILFVIRIIYRNKKALAESDHWKFLADRPISSALFINVVTLGLLMVYSPYFNDLRLAFIVVGGIASVRVFGLVISRPWKKQAVYFVMIVFLVSELLGSIYLPLPLTRLYIFLVSLVALYLLVRWTKQCIASHEAVFYIWLLRMVQMLFVVIIVTELWGNDGIASYLFSSTIASMAYTLPYIFFIYMIYGGLHWLFFSSPVWEVKLLRNDAAVNVQKVGVLFAAGIVGFAVLPAILVAWDVYENILDTTTAIYSYEFTLGTFQISVGMLVGSVAIFYCASLISRIFPRVILDEKVSGRKLDRGVLRSIAQLIRYVIIFVGFLLAIFFIGFDFTNLTIILSAFGIGIGFGLQGIVNNFVSGLILLFERPLTEGDTIEIGTDRAHIKKIGLRSTVVTTLDQAELIIPNADLINNQVTNWTLTNRQVRLCVPVGVAYGSDVSLAVETIMASVKKQKEVLKSPVAEVLFMDFGESSLNFELRVWIEDVDRRAQVRSALYHDIEWNFRELNIVIPFPQRDLHLPGFEDSAGLPKSPVPGKAVE